jgi:hypothetical protein
VDLKDVNKYFILEFKMENEIVTIITAVSSIVFGIFIKMQKDYTDKLKNSYDEKVLILQQRLDSLEKKCNQYEQRIETLNNKLMILQEEFEINIPVLIHDIDGHVIYKNKEAQYIEIHEYKDFFKTVPREKKAYKEVYIDNKPYMLVSVTKSFTFANHILTFVFEKELFCPIHR